MEHLIIKGAREHNLKNIDLTLPRDKLIVVSGLSGSGKSSLAFDTIFAEGQRRYVESLSAYARQFLGRMDKPDLDYIEGLSPAISIEQKTTHRNPRSTVGTVTEIYDYYRLLFARAGIPHCPKCGRVIKEQSVDQIVDTILSFGTGDKVQLLSPVIRGKKGEHTKIIEDARKAGFARARIDGVMVSLDEAIKLDKQKKHTIEIVVDRLVISPDIRSRLAESVETALEAAEGIMLLIVDSRGEGKGGGSRGNIVADPPRSSPTLATQAGLGSSATPSAGHPMASRETLSAFIPFQRHGVGPKNASPQVNATGPRPAHEGIPKDAPPPSQADAAAAFAEEAQNSPEGGQPPLPGKRASASPAASEFFFSQHNACPDCGVSIPELQPRLFSFNNPFGACPECDGLGAKLEFDPDLVIPNPELSFDEGGCVPYNPDSAWNRSRFEALARQYKFKLSTPFKDIPKKAMDAVLYGSEKAIPVHYENRSGTGAFDYHTRFPGILEDLKRRYLETNSTGIKEWLEKFMSQKPCARCGGRRLKPEALAVTVGGKNIHELASLSVADSITFFQNLKLSKNEAQIAREILKEINARLGFMQNVGLDYLSLERKSATLSGGEAQRIRLATQIGSSLVGVLYILDEPSIGLHQRDNQRLIDTLIYLRNLGNTLIVVEHDEQTLRTADYLVDLGPGAGVHGGKVIAQGTPEEVAQVKESLTGQFLAGTLTMDIPAERRKGNGNVLSLKNVTEHNLKGIDVDIPLGAFTCITGVSGSGKSTLLSDVLYPVLANRVYGSAHPEGAYGELAGDEFIDKVIDIDQSPIGRTPRSNPATYVGVFGGIRDLFASLPESKARGYKPGRFSFNVKGGRCENCAGDGTIKIEMNFLPDVYVTCEVCHGKRFNKETLEVRYKGKNIADVLDMTIEEAAEFFAYIPHIARKMDTLLSVGLGYVKLGQSALTLSGGEAQRVKLALELSKRSTGKTFYILDEPTTGLHFADVKQLMEVIQRLVNQGNTVVMIEHNLDVLLQADHLIDLGPEGGDRGGELITTGTPEEVARCKKSWTGKYLKEQLERLDKRNA
ncbi:MAG: excinuclease ABC subunit UvrA [Spirochaetaceae bacterium]|nr:excinuclease ABC subunit UvrA [Spirochaetaceae bacterium]